MVPERMSCLRRAFSTSLHRAIVDSRGRWCGDFVLHVVIGLVVGLLAKRKRDEQIIFSDMNSRSPIEFTFAD